MLGRKRQIPAHRVGKIYYQQTINRLQIVESNKCYRDRLSQF